MEYIRIRGARTHNLKNVNLDLPRNRLIVVTGLSGSGKSSLAFDTLYAEGQRRYVESLSAYARQFLEQMEKPDCDAIEGLSPAIAIEAKGTGRNPRSTVGTVTEIADYLRLLYARVGRPLCYSCGREIAAQTVQQVVDRLTALPADTRLFVAAPALLQRTARLPDVRRLLPGARAALLLLQQPARRLPRVRRARRRAPLRSGADRPQAPGAAPRRALLRGAARAAAARGGARGPRGAVPLPPGHALQGPAGHREGRAPRGLGRARGRVRARRPHRPPAVRRPPRALPAPPAGDALPLGPGGPGRPGARPAVHRLRGHAAPPRGALRARRGAEHRRGVGASHWGCARLLPRPRSLAHRERDRAPDREGDPGAPRLPDRRRARLPGARSRRGDALGWRRPAHPARDPDRLEAGCAGLRHPRASHRPPPARQRASPRHPPPAPRPR